MTKDDKVFIAGLIKGLEGRFDEFENSFKGLEGRFDEFENSFKGFEGRFDELTERVEENSRGIRYNGMVIELMRDDISLIREADSLQAERGAKIDAMFESMGLELPALKQALSNHGKRITALETKRG